MCVHSHPSNRRQRAQRLLTLAILCGLGTLVSPAAAQSTANVNLMQGNGINGGVNSSIINPNPNGNAGVFQGVGNAVNGNANGALMNSNNITTGSNTLQNQNISAPQLIAPAQAVGGSSALVLPRNPLMLPNALFGRSNFGLQFGVNNNPGFGNVFGNGANAMSWFMQGGVTIPFGKVPDFVSNPKNAQIDQMRQQQLESERRTVFGQPMPNQTPDANGRGTVSGKIVGLSAYQYTPAAAPKVDAVQDAAQKLDIVPVGLNGPMSAPAPRVLALEAADAFSQPLNTGEKVGKLEIGHEYAYHGHTRSGWVKLLLPNGSFAWARTKFEYVKYDYTQVDELADAMDDTPVPAASAVKAAQPSAKPKPAVTAHRAPVRHAATARSHARRHVAYRGPHRSAHRVLARPTASAKMVSAVRSSESALLQGVMALQPAPLATR